MEAMNGFVIADRPIHINVVIDKSQTNNANGSSAQATASVGRLDDGLYTFCQMLKTPFA